MTTIEQIKSAISDMKMASDGDDWGNTMHWWFTVADEMFWNRSIPVPAAWQFQPSPLGPQNDPDDWVYDTVRDLTDEALLRFGMILTRYAERLKRAGRSY